jgi:hypothetical protein
MLTVKKVNRVILIPYRSIDLFKPFTTRESSAFVSPCLCFLARVCQLQPKKCIFLQTITFLKVHIAAMFCHSKGTSRWNVFNIQISEALVDTIPGPGR